MVSAMTQIQVSEPLACTLTARQEKIATSAEELRNGELNHC